MKATRALVLFLLTVLLCPALASAGTLGPALNYEELLDMVRRAKDGDILLVSGEMTATEEAILPRSAANLRRRQGRSASAAHQRLLRRPLRRGAAGFPDDFRHIQRRAAHRPR